MQGQEGKQGGGEETTGQQRPLGTPTSLPKVPREAAQAGGREWVPCKHDCAQQLPREHQRKTPAVQWANRGSGKVCPCLHPSESPGKGLCT